MNGFNLVLLAFPLYLLVNKKAAIYLGFAK